MYGAPRGFQKGFNAANMKPPLLDLPPNLRAMFDPNAPIVFKPPIEKRTLPPYSGIGKYVGLFETTPPPPREPFVPPVERKAQLREKAKELHKERNELLAADYDPSKDPKATGNAYATLFVSRLSYDTTEKKLKRELERFGPIKSLRIVRDQSDGDGEGKSRGYGFVEFEREDDMLTCLKRAGGGGGAVGFMKIDGRGVVLDVERGRTVRGWRPTRLGGGVGGRTEKKKQPEDGRTAAADRGDRADSRDRDRDRDRGRGGGGDRDHRDARDRDRDRDRDREGRRRSRSRSPARRRSSRSRDNRSAYRPSDRGDRDRDRDRDRGRGGGGGGGGGGDYYGYSAGGGGGDRSGGRDRRY